MPHVRWSSQKLSCAILYILLTEARGGIIMEMRNVKRPFLYACILDWERRTDMPPKPKFTKEEIIRTALEIVSQKGIEALTAKELGDALGSSARPIFTVFSSMREVQEAVREAAMRQFEHFVNQKLDMPLFKQVGMRMVLFGVQEPKLYQLLFMQENQKAVSFADVFGALGPTAETCVSRIRQEYGMNEREAALLFENVWIYTFGIGALCATQVCRFSEERLGQMLSTEFQAMLLYVRSAANAESDAGEK